MVSDWCALTFKGGNITALITLEPLHPFHGPLTLYVLM